MESVELASLTVTVVEGGGSDAGDRSDRVADALAPEGEIAVETVPAVEPALGDGDGEAECVVVVDADDYETVRDCELTVPVVVVAPDVDREILDRVVGDPQADHVAPEPGLGTALAARVDRLADSAGAEWRLADFADDAVVEFALDTFALVEANDRFFEAWGWDRDRLADATLADLRETDITHELRGRGRGDAGEEELEWVRDEDPVASLVDRALGGLYEVREWHCQTADGDPFKSEVKVVAEDDTGRGYLVASVPSTDGDEATGDPTVTTEPEEASMLRALVDHVPMSVYFKDRQSRHVLASEDVVEPFVESPEGKILHTPADVIGKTDFDLYPAPGAAEGVEEDQDVMATGRPLVDKTERIQPPHGRPLFFQTTKAPWYDDKGRVHGVVGVTVDVTEQKRRELELDRQNERLAEFASIVSHDLRNPLNVAKGRLQQYRRTDDESELDAVAEMHERMETLIEDVLAFAREGSRVEDPEWLDGADHAAEAWSAVDTADATVEQTWAYRIRADPDRLDRLFENLFRNAMEHAGPDVTVEVGTLADDSGFYVADDGPGIPEADREDVFDRGMTTMEEGTGFGLAIVKEIAEAHGWEVAATESAAGGARFEFRGVPRGSEPG